MLLHKKAGTIHSKWQTVIAAFLSANLSPTLLSLVVMIIDPFELCGR
jgi:hypothetical protein